MAKKRRVWLNWLLIAAAGMVLLAAANFQTVILAYAALTAERRPDVLRDADWNDPNSARLFRDKFPAGSSEADLLNWLGDNRFEIDQSAKLARRNLASIPCNETVEVTWRSDAARVLQEAQVVIKQAGCL